MTRSVRAVRILHTSDWHLGRRFFGRSLVSDQEYVLDQMMNLARDLRPDILLVAGDVFHQREPDHEAVTLFHDSLNRFLSLGMAVVFLAGPTDDFKALHLGSRWVRNAGVYLFEDATQVLSPLKFRGNNDDFDVNFWCLPFPKSTEFSKVDQHPALFGRGLVEKVVQRLNPNELNLFTAYAWAQDSGRRSELGALVQSGGQPLEKRMLDFFDVAALGGCHQPAALLTHAHYSGSLLCYEPDELVTTRSACFYEIESKEKVYIDTYPLRPRRALKVLTGSWEELVEQGRQVRNDDLIVLRSEERDLSAEQRAELRILAPNIVSVELPSPFSSGEEGREFSTSPLVSDFCDFVRSQAGRELDDEELAILKVLEEQL